MPPKTILTLVCNKGSVIFGFLIHELSFAFWKIRWLYSKCFMTLLNFNSYLFNPDFGSRYRRKPSVLTGWSENTRGTALTCSFWLNICCINFSFVIWNLNLLRYISLTIVEVFQLIEVKIKKNVPQKFCNIISMKFFVALLIIFYL